MWVKNTDFFLLFYCLVVFKNQTSSSLKHANLKLKKKQDLNLLPEALWTSQVN